MNQNTHKEKAKVSASLFANQAIMQLLRNPEKLAEHQNQMMETALTELEEVEQLIPGLADTILQANSQLPSEQADLAATVMSAKQNNNSNQLTQEWAKTIATDSAKVRDKALSAFHQDKANGEKGVDKADKTVSADATTDFINAALAGSKLSASDQQEADSFAQAIMPSVANIFTDPNVQGFLSAFNLPAINVEMIGQDNQQITEITEGDQSA